MTPKRKPKGLVVTVVTTPYGDQMAHVRSDEARSGSMEFVPLYICSSQLRRTGCRPTSKPTKWRFWAEKVEE